MVMDGDIAHCRHSLWYLKGQGFIQTGELDKAFDCFKTAFGGIGELSCLPCLSLSSDSDSFHETEISNFSLAWRS